MSTTTEEITPAEEQMAIDELAQAIEDVVLHGKPIWQVCGWNPEQIEGLYSIGYHYFESGAYEEALKVFKPLVLLDSADSRNWLALGATRQMLGQYESAIESFAPAAVLEPENPKPFFNALECHVALKNYDKAKEAAHYIIAIASDKREHAALIARVKVILGALEAKSN